MTKRIKATAATLTSKKSKLKRTIVLNKLSYLREYMISAAKDIDYFSDVEPRAQEAADELLGAAAIVKSWIGGFTKDLKVNP